MVVRQEPQTKSTMLMNEWNEMREEEEEEEEKRRIDAEGGGTYAHRTTV